MRSLIAFAALVVMTTSAAGQTAQDRTLSGNLGSRNARATFDLQLQTGQIVTLTTTSAQNVDTVLALSAPGGRRVAENDDAQPGVLQSRIVYVARTSGRHTATVTGYNGATGAFELEISYGLDVGLSDEARVLREETLAFTQSAPERRFEVDLAEDEVFVASTFGITEGLDTTLTLQDAQGTILAQNDDRGDGTLNSQIVYQAARAGRYVIVASTYGREGVGDYVISLATDPNAEAPFNFGAIEGTPLVNYDGEINDAQPNRQYQIQLAAGQTILAIAETVTGDLDPVLQLSTADGYPVALNDDRGDGSLNSAFAYTSPAAATYTLELSRYQQSNTSGTFRLVVTNVDASVVDTLQALVENPVTLSGTEQIIQTADFDLHYTLEGPDASTLAYAQATAAALQEMYDAQIRRIGWAPPVRDADGRYRAYVGNVAGAMGYTKPVQIVFDNASTANVRERAAARTVFVIDNDFAGMGKKASPESLMRATATHEFNHVVQFGYDALEGLHWLYESTASWTETNTAGVDQDATDYVATDYAAPEVCWTTTTEGHDYAQWTLLQSLADSYGDRFVVQLWENAVTYDGFETMTRTLAGVNGNIPDVIQRWRAQNFARDYDLAPRFTRSVALAGTISRNGVFAPRNEIQQLGANYLALQLDGPRHFALRGDNNLELVGLGQRNGRIEVIPLGRGGVFDVTAFEHAAMMVFNRAVPSAPGVCSGVTYSINVTQAAGANPAARYHFDARHFRRPT